MSTAQELMSKQEFLSEDSVSALRQLLGKTIHTLFAPNLDAAGGHLAAWTLSMQLSKGSFMNFSCEWSETPHFLNDSWQITVAEGHDPLKIQINDTGSLMAPCTISMYEAKPIKRIDIFAHTNSADDEGPEEIVNYDQAILFTRDGDTGFCIGCMLNGPGIATHLHFSEDSEVIRTMVDGASIRLTLC